MNQSGLAWRQTETERRQILGPSFHLYGPSSVSIVTSQLTKPHDGICLDVPQGKVLTVGKSGGEVMRERKCSSPSSSSHSFDFTSVLLASSCFPHLASVPGSHWIDDHKQNHLLRSIVSRPDPDIGLLSSKSSRPIPLLSLPLQQGDKDRPGLV